MKKAILLGTILLSLAVLPKAASAYGTLTLSQSSVNLNTGQNVAITAYPQSGQVVNLTSISNTFVAYANISGNQITIYALGSGSTNMTFCTFDNSCASVQVTVNGTGTGGTGQISFSQNNISLSTNQTLAVSVYNTNGSIYISNNSNSSIVSAYVSGSTINLTGITPGSTTITVCASNSTCNYLYVTVGGSTGTGQISFSQNNVALTTNQTMTVSVYNSAGSIYISSNSNSNIVSAYVSGSNINLTGASSGSSTITVCGSNATCNYLYVTVNGTGSGQITFSQNNLSLSTNQTMTVSVYNSNGTIYISNNSNSSVVSAYVSGSAINLTGVNNGSATITVCGSSASCNYLYVTVNGTGSGQITFSQNNVALNTNQTMMVSVYNTNGSIYISNNSNSSVVSAYVSGNSINLTGISSGSSAITVCGSNSTCNILYVTVNGSSSGQLTFSQNNINLNVNQIQTVSVYNSNNSIYISNNSNASVVGAYISGTSVSLTGINSGSSTITVCGSNSACGYLYVTVGGIGTTGQITFSPSTVNINFNQTATVTIYSSNSYNYGYYISSNSNPSIATASISGSTLNLYAQSYGTTNISVCLNSSQCGILYVTVSNNNQGNLYFTSTTLPQPVLNQYYSYQLNVTGGTAPYTYVINSGALPAGLTLSSNGQIYGTAYSTYATYFTVKVSDYYNNTGLSQNFNMTPTTGTVAGALIYNNGTLLNDNGTIYITYKNTKSSFANAAAFTGLGYSFANAAPASTSALTFSGFTIGSPNIAHPWGSWIKNGSTIYFVHDQGLIPIASMDVFTNNGGILQDVVNANIYDMSKPLQTVLTMNDPRLQ